MSRRTTWISKVLKREIERDSSLSYQLQLAERLGKTLSELRQQLTQEELLLWMVNDAVQSERRVKERQARARRSRR